MLYYLKSDGNLYEYNEDGDRLVHSFPTYMVYYCNESNAFVYWYDNAIWAYSPHSKTVQMLVTAENTCEGADYVFGINTRFLCYRINQQNVITDIETHTTSVIEEPIHNVVVSNDTCIVYQSENYCLMIYFFETRESKQLLEGSAFPIISSCIMDDYLYYVRSEGILYSIPMPDMSDTPIVEEEVVVNTDGNRILGIADTDGAMLCIAVDHNNYTTEPFLLNPYGEMVSVGGPYKLYHGLRGGCKLAHTRNRYIYSLTQTDQFIVGFY